MNVTPHFTREELACKCGCGRMEIPQPSIDRLERVRVRCGFPFPITSADRCPQHNAKVSGTGTTGPHTKGAFDVGVHGNQAITVVRIALEEGFTGIGISQKGPQGQRFVHLDDLPDAPGQPRPWMWSY